MRDERNKVVEIYSKVEKRNVWIYAANYSFTRLPPHPLGIYRFNYMIFPVSFFSSHVFLDTYFSEEKLSQLNLARNKNLSININARWNFVVSKKGPRRLFDISRFVPTIFSPLSFQAFPQNT